MVFNSHDIYTSLPCDLRVENRRGYKKQLEYLCGLDMNFGFARASDSSQRKGQVTAREKGLTEIT